MISEMMMMGIEFPFYPNSDCQKGTYSFSIKQKANKSEAEKLTQIEDEHFLFTSV